MTTYEKDKVGLGIITYNREDYFKQVYETIPFDRIGHSIVINDGTPYAFKPDKSELIQHTENIGVGRSKNQALQYLINKGCEYLFLLEDDILIKKPEVFEEYIRIANITGIHHLNFEVTQTNPVQATFIYEENASITLYKNPWASFSYFRKNVIDKLGAFDEGYMNAFEHIDLIYRYSRAGIMPPFWYFPDISNSTEYLEPIPNSIKNSTITNKDNYQSNWQLSAQRFIQVHGGFTNEIPEVGNKKAINILLQLQKLYGQP